MNNHGPDNVSTSKDIAETVNHENCQGMIEKVNESMLNVAKAMGALGNAILLLEDGNLFDAHESLELVAFNLNDERQKIDILVNDYLGV